MVMDLKSVVAEWTEDFSQSRQLVVEITAEELESQETTSTASAEFLITMNKFEDRIESIRSRHRAHEL